MTVRVKSGGVTATITGMESATVRAIMGRAMGGALRAMEDRAEALAAEARREWYGPSGVERETGKSGDIQVVTTADLDRGEVRVSIGSADDRKAGKGGKPVAVFVHRASSRTLRARAVTQEDWWAWKRRGAPTLPPPFDEWWRRKEHGRGLARDRWYVLMTGSGEDKNVATPGSAGYWLLQDLVKKPGRKLAKEMASDVARAIAQAVNRG